jgi:hypothetical protein
MTVCNEFLGPCRELRYRVGRDEFCAMLPNFCVDEAIPCSDCSSFDLGISLLIL